MSEKTLDAAAGGQPRDAWLFMFAQGGRWQPAELALRVPTVSPMPVILQAMMRSGHVRQFSTGRRSSEYAVTRTCKLPAGLTLQQLIDAGALGTQKDATP